MTEDDDDIPADGAVQLAIHGLTIADDCTAKQAATALWVRFREDWCVELVYWLKAEAALAAEAKRQASLVKG